MQPRLQLLDDDEEGQPRLGLAQGLPAQDERSAHMGAVQSAAAAPGVSQPPPQAAQSPDLIQYLSQKYQMPSGLDLQGLQQAQSSDLQRANLMGLGQAGERAAAMVQQRAPDFTGLTPDQLNLRNYLAQRQVAQEDMERNLKIGMLPVTLGKSMLELQKLGAETQKIGSESRKATAEAKGSEIENGPASPAMLGMAQKLGVPLQPETTNKQAREILDAEAKRQNIQIDWSKVGLEKQKMNVELAKLTSEHPMEPIPGFRYVGQGMPLSRDSEPVKAIATQAATTTSLKKTLDRMQQIYDRAGASGRLVGSDAQTLDTLRAKLSGTIGRNASGGRLAEYDVELAKGQLPDPTSPNPFRGGAFRPDRMHAAIDAIKSMADLDLSEQARAHNMIPTIEAARAANQKLLTSGVQDPAKRKAILRDMGY